MLIGPINQKHVLALPPYPTLSAFPDNLRLQDAPLIVLKREPLTFWVVDGRFGVPGRRP